MSLFIQDKTQASDGVIHLNFVGTNVIHTPVGNKPGTYSFKSGKSGQVHMLHTYQCSDNTMETRLQGTTQPWIGDNLYGADRAVPKVPWKIEEGMDTMKQTKILDDMHEREKAA